MLHTELFSTPVSFASVSDIREQLLESIPPRTHMVHIVSLNPENLIRMKHNSEFEKVVRTTRMHLPDGIGTTIALHILKGVSVARLTGVDTMDMLIGQASKRSLRILLIGGKGNLAEKTADCYKSRYKNLPIWAVTGYQNIFDPHESETKHIETIVRSIKPHLIFVSFGSPQQEIWIERHRDLFQGCVVMGVGGAFAMVSGELPRAPRLVRIVGLEWLYRLVREPWRIWRQLKLAVFIVMVVRERLGK